MTYFWEIEGSLFKELKLIFQDKAYRKFSLAGSGIFNLIKWQNTLYEVKFSQLKKPIPVGNPIFSDVGKKEILSLMQEHFHGTIIDNKSLSFVYMDFIVKAEVVKKRKEPA